jgi:hypothetical protein
VLSYTHNSELAIQNLRAFGSSSALDAPANAGMPCGNSPFVDALGAFALSPIVATQKMKATSMQKKNVHKAMIAAAEPSAG